MTFDLEKARAEVATASARGFSESREQARIFCAEEILPDALDEIERLNAHINSACIESLRIAEEQAAEIERLREALDESEQILAHKTKTATHWYEEGLKTRADLAQSKRVVEQQAARIRLLDEVCCMNKNERIKFLEDALVDERIIGEGGFRAGQCEFWYIEDLPEESCMELDGLCDWATCPKKQELRDIARKQLQAEGKIGPDADAKPHCWQIYAKKLLKNEHEEVDW